MDNFEKKYAKFDEVVKLVQEAVKEPENSGNYHDYIEPCGYLLCPWSQHHQEGL